MAGRTSGLSPTSHARFPFFRPVRPLQAKPYPVNRSTTATGSPLHVRYITDRRGSPHMRRSLKYRESATGDFRFHVSLTSPLPLPYQGGETEIVVEKQCKG